MKHLLIALPLLAILPGAAANAAPAPPGPTAAAAIPLDDNGFTAYVLAKINVMSPSRHARIAEPLAIELQDFGMLGLDRMQRACRNNPGQCDTMVTDFVSKSLALKPSSDVNVTMLRAALRPSDYVSNMATLLARRSVPTSLLQRPFAGDLTEVCLIDSPDTARIATTKDAEDLHLTSDAMLAACEANIAKSENLGDVKGLAEGEAGMLGGDFYMSSVALLREGWKPVADRFGGQLVIAIPSPDIVLYGRGRGPALITRLRGAITTALKLTDRPLSVELYQWTTSGWTVVPR